MWPGCSNIGDTASYLISSILLATLRTRTMEVAQGTNRTQNLRREIREVVQAVLLQRSAFRHVRLTETEAA